MDSTLRIALAQFDYLAPEAVRFAGRKYARTAQGIVTYTDTAIHVPYLARRKRGEMIPSKLIVSVEYDRGRDLYNVEIKHFDGESFEEKTVTKSESVTFDYFDDIQTMITIAA